MICDLSKDPYSAGIAAEKPFEDTFTGVVEELGNCDRIRGCCCVTDCCTSSWEGVFGIFNAG
jgi:hypothetical protein